MTPNTDANPTSFLVNLTFVLLYLIHWTSSPAWASAGASSADTPTFSELSFTPDMLVTSLIIFVAIVLFLWEPVRLDFVALSLPVVLVVLGPWTGITASEALLGFSSKATITVLAMFILSEGVRKSGSMQILGRWISRITGRNEFRQLSVLSTVSGSLAGLINNTPVVSIFIPMVDDLAEQTKTSPSHLLIPLSYAAMMGGTLTLIGTSTNLLASDVSARLIDHPFGMFEFTKLGVVVLIVGLVYLITIGRFLVPERIDPEQTVAEEYEMGEYITEVILDETSDLNDCTIEKIREETGLDLNLIQILRNGERINRNLEEVSVRAGDHLFICNDNTTISQFVTRSDVTLVPGLKVSGNQVIDSVSDLSLIEVVVGHGDVEGNTLRELHFSQRFNAPVLAIRRGERLTHRSIDRLPLESGDVLLVLAGDDTVERLYNNRNYIVAHELSPSELRVERILLTLGIVGGVVTLAAAGVLDIVISAIAGVLVMILTGALKPGEVYNSVDWEVIFLLAGLIPLGIALQETGTAEYLALSILHWTQSWPPLVLLGIFYLLTALLTNIISNNASVILMVPIAVDAAIQMGANPFSFVLVVTFAASTAFMTPVGYQTNLMVYGPGGYHFKDFIRAGAPLQLLMTAVIPLGVYFFWGV